MAVSAAVVEGPTEVAETARWAEAERVLTAPPAVLALSDLPAAPARRHIHPPARPRPAAGVALLAKADSPALMGCPGVAAAEEQLHMPIWDQCFTAVHPAAMAPSVPPAVMALPVRWAAQVRMAPMLHRLRY